MMNVRVDHSCGTPMCHAGWYAVANKLGVKFFGIIKRNVSYSAGTELMAKNLGMENKEKLCNWAMNNSKIWGNSYGMSIFSDKRAFISNKRPFGAESLRDIIDHWKEVRDRLIAIENSVVYKDITTKLAVLPIEETSDLLIVKNKEKIL